MDFGAKRNGGNVSGFLIVTVPVRVSVPVYDVQSITVPAGAVFTALSSFDWNNEEAVLPNAPGPKVSSFIVAILC